MKETLIHFLKKYGNDFFHKLSIYRTAKYDKEFVSILNFNVSDLTVAIRDTQNREAIVSVFELDDFCL